MFYVELNELKTSINNTVLLKLEVNLTRNIWKNDTPNISNVTVMKETSNRKKTIYMHTHDFNLFIKQQNASVTVCHYLISKSDRQRESFAHSDSTLFP